MFTLVAFEAFTGVVGAHSKAFATVFAGLLVAGSGIIDFYFAMGTLESVLARTVNKPHTIVGRRYTTIVGVTFFSAAFEALAKIGVQTGI